MGSTFSLSKRLGATRYCVPFTSGNFLPLCGGQFDRLLCTNLRGIRTMDNRPAENKVAEQTPTNNARKEIARCGVFAKCPYFKGIGQPCAYKGYCSKRATSSVA